jgi:hypothetical protein
MRKIVAESSCSTARPDDYLLRGGAGAGNLHPSEYPVV